MDISARAISLPDRPRVGQLGHQCPDRKSTRLNSSHQIISYAVFCLKKKNTPLFCFTQNSHHLLMSWESIQETMRRNWLAGCLVLVLKRKTLPLCLYCAQALLYTQPC